MRAQGCDRRHASAATPIDPPAGEPGKIVHIGTMEESDRPARTTAIHGVIHFVIMANCLFTTLSP